MATGLHLPARSQLVWWGIFPVLLYPVKWQVGSEGVLWKDLGKEKGLEKARQLVLHEEDCEEHSTFESLACDTLAGWGFKYIDFFCPCVQLPHSCFVAHVTQWESHLHDLVSMKGFATMHLHNKIYAATACIVRTGKEWVPSTVTQCIAKGSSVIVFFTE